MFSDCSFEDNHAQWGAVAYAESSSLAIQNCSILKNRGHRSGAFLRATATSPLVSGCTIFLNSGGYQDGSIAQLISGSGTRAEFVDCTVFGFGIANTTYGFFEVRDTDTLFERCVFAFSQSGPVATITGGGVPEFAHCIAFGTVTGDTLPGNAHDNLFVDPLFCNIFNEDYDVCSNSPCLPGNNAWGLTIGGAPQQGCGDCVTPVKATSWGAIKALYR